MGIILLRAAMALGSFVALGQSETSLTPEPPPPLPVVAPMPPVALTPAKCFAPLSPPRLWNPAANMAVTPVRAFDAQLPPGFVMPRDPIALHLVREYGAMLVARGVVRPMSVLFPDEDAVTTWQATVPMQSAVIGGLPMTLQSPAMDALKAAIAEARVAKLAIGPAGPDASRRDYARTIFNWTSRVDRGLTHWRAARKLPAADAAAITALSPAAQIPRILALEEQGLCFATSLDKTILRSVAAPGSSQHVFMLAFDVKQHGDARIRAILARHGWHQTVVTDAPHFTYLGADVGALPGLGLKRVTAGGRDYWVPDID